MSDEVFELKVERHIAAVPETVWRAMTERVEDWFCLEPWRAERATSALIKPRRSIRAAAE